MTEWSPMTVGMFSFDCRDVLGLAGFWSRLLDQPIDEGATEDFAMIGFDAEGPTWMFQRRDDAPQGDNRLMLDLGGYADWREHADRIEALGAKRISDNEVDRVRWVEFRDPENNTFRIFGPRPD